MSTESMILASRIIAKIAEGTSLEDAIDCVLPPGTYDRLIDEIFSDLHAKLDRPRQEVIDIEVAKNQGPHP